MRSIRAGRPAEGEAQALEALRSARREVRKVVRKARVAWLEATIARIETVKAGGQPIDPADAWKAMEEIAAGMDGTKAPKSVPVRGKDKKLAATDKEQLDIFVEHFITVFNRTSTYDKSVLASLEQRPTMHEIGTAPDIHEVTTFFRQAKNGKATGLSGTSAELYKAISRSRELAKIMAGSRQSQGTLARPQFATRTPADRIWPARRPLLPIVTNLQPFTQETMPHPSQSVLPLMPKSGIVRLR